MVQCYACMIFRVIYTSWLVYTNSAKISLTLITLSSSFRVVTKILLIYELLVCILSSRGRTLVDTCWPWEIVEWLSTSQQYAYSRVREHPKDKVLSAHSILQNKIPIPNSTTCKLRTLLQLVYLFIFLAKVRCPEVPKENNALCYYESS